LKIDVPSERRCDASVVNATVVMVT
jgi:hypothetical protein